ncbi:uncharacterized protein LOC144342552 [Saccoglossus kowalevskii]
MDDANSKLKTGYCDDPLDGSNHHSGTRSPVKVTHDGLLTTYHTETAVITINFGSVSDETSSEEGEDEVSGKEAQNEAENSIGGTEVVRNHAQECSPLTMNVHVNCKEMIIREVKLKLLRRVWI